MTKGAINVMSQTLANALGTRGITVNAVMPGPADPYLNPDLARHLAGRFRHADLHLVRGASHWPQWDQPAAVARLLLTLPER
jgi:NAD(P)-dependent dehydrogenase (short-subunit alcohol dehydrogenase family)